MNSRQTFLFLLWFAAVYTTIRCNLNSLSSVVKGCSNTGIGPKIMRDRQEASISSSYTLNGSTNFNCRLHEHYRIHRLLSVEKKLLEVLHKDDLDDEEHELPVVTEELHRRIRDVLKIDFDDREKRDNHFEKRRRRFYNAFKKAHMFPKGSLAPTDKALIKSVEVWGQRNIPGTDHPPDVMRTYFDLFNMTDKVISNSTLYFTVKKPVVTVGDSFEVRIHVYRYISPSEIAASPLITLNYKFKTTQRKDDEHFFASLNMTNIVKEWARAPRKYFGMMIRATYNDEDLVNRTVDEKNFTNHIVLHIAFNNHATSLYNQEYYDEPVCTVDQHENRCCRYHLEVDFERLGWDWIVSPKRYDAFYCAGTCPYLYKQRTVHTHFTQQMDALKRDSSTGPCCAPSLYKPLKLFFVGNDGNVHERMVDNMMVSRCVCV